MTLWAFFVFLPGSMELMRHLKRVNANVIDGGVNNMSESESAMVSRIVKHVIHHGEMTNKAKSCWGRDQWELNGLTVGLEDDGFTDYIRYGDTLECRDDHHGVKYSIGGMSDLFRIHKGLMN